MILLATINNKILIIWFFIATQNPSNSLIPEVLKWNVKMASASLNENEKLHLRFVFPKSVNVANVGTGGFSNIGVIYPAPPWIIGKAIDVSIDAIYWSSPLKKSFTLTSGRLISKWKFFCKTNAKNVFNYFKWAFSANS